MSRRHRDDAPGAIHHVGNRGIAKRAIFESDSDRRYFLSRLAWLVRANRIHVLAYSLMTNHFHLMLRSVDGGLDRSICWATNQHVRRFNRRVRRDGPLFRGRFFSRRVEDPSYGPILVRYIDHNAVSAGLAANPCDYRWSSAYWMRQRRQPPWLCAEFLKTLARGTALLGEYSHGLYEQSMVTPLSDAQQWSVERWVSSPSRKRKAEDWLAQKAVNADGGRCGFPIHPDQVSAAVAAAFIPHGDRRLIIVGLWRSVSGLSIREIASLSERATPTVQRWLNQHRRRIAEDEAYATTFTTCLTMIDTEPGQLTITDDDGGDAGPR